MNIPISKLADSLRESQETKTYQFTVPTLAGLVTFLVAAATLNDSPPTLIGYEVTSSGHLATIRTSATIGQLRQVAWVKASNEIGQSITEFSQQETSTIKG